MSPTPSDPTAFSCEDVLERLEAFVDGDLPATEATALRAHFEGAGPSADDGPCAACARELALARSVLEGLRGLPEESCPPALVERAFDRARREAEAQRFVSAEGSSDGDAATERHGWWLGLAAAAAVLLVLGALGLSRLLPDDPSAATVADVQAADQHADDASTLDPSTMDADELERATEEARLALAYVASIGRRSALVLRDDVVGDNIIGPSARALQRAMEPLRPERASAPAGAETGDPR